MAFTDVSTVETTINVPISKAFDFITQARFWPQWHPFTRATSGVTERPYQPGDRFTEFGRLGDQPIELTWEVKEHNRPYGAVIVSKNLGGETTITYVLEELDEHTTRFTRTIAADEAALAIIGQDDISSEGEEAPVAALKALVEDFVRREAHEQAVSARN